MLLFLTNWGTKTPKLVVCGMLKDLQEEKATIAVAESCKDNVERVD